MSELEALAVFFASPFSDYITGPGLAEGVIRNMPGHVMDLTPTVYELVGINPAEEPVYDDKLQPAGQSLIPIWQEDKADDDRMLVTELFGNGMVRMGRWKAEFMDAPLGIGELKLFDIVADPSAMTNFADNHPRAAGGNEGRLRSIRQAQRHDRSLPIEPSWYWRKLRRAYD